jgi:hypothetical protein
VMMVKAFAIRWPFSRHRRAYSQIIKAALRRQDDKTTRRQERVF